MTKKILTLGDAISKTQTIISRLTLSELNFNVMYNGKEKSFRIFGVTHCDSIKVICPEFKIQQDVRQKRYAELTINYE